MKKFLLYLLFLCFSISSFSQGKLVFSYDSAGNQILRDKICVGCAQQTTAIKTEVDSLQTNDLKDGLKEVSEDDGVRFTAYPNPVTNILQTYWFNTKTKYIGQMSLFSSKNKLLFHKALQREEESLDIDFSGLPSGVYILEFLYNTNEKEFYRIIKK